MDPNNPTQGEVVIGSEVVPHSTTPVEEKEDFDHQRSAAALKFDVPADKLAKDQHKTEKESDDKPATMNADLEAFLRPTALCNLATVKEEQAEGEATMKWRTTGEPTEIALQVFAHRFDFGKKGLEAKGWKQIAEYPFDSTIKRMSVVYKTPDDSHWVVYTKGAVERVLDLCTSIGTGDRNEPMTDAMKETVLAQMDHFARQGQRVLAVASKEWPGEFKIEKKKDKDGKDEKHGTNVDELRPQVEAGLTLLGLVGIYDPPRDETKDSIRECSEAGIKVHMLTVSRPDPLGNKDHSNRKPG